MKGLRKIQKEKNGSRKAVWVVHLWPRTLCRVKRQWMKNPFILLLFLVVRLSTEKATEPRERALQIRRRTWSCTLGDHGDGQQ